MLSEVQLNIVMFIAVMFSLWDPFRSWWSCPSILLLVPANLVAERRLCCEIPLKEEVFPN
jgi:hypothetical protein